MSAEYSIYITYRCNLRCSFCYVRDRLSNQSPVLTDEKMDQVIDYIAKDKSDKEKIITFLGGEPLFDYKVAEKFIKKTKNFGWLYSMYTNGLLLNSVPIDTLKLFDIILVSLDGDKKAQEKHRGIGTYKRVVDGIKRIKPKIKATIIGRTTVTPETDIFKSVTNSLKYVDFVHWQIANMPKFYDADKFIKNYEKGVEKLFIFWLSNLKNGKLLNIIPFQAIVASLIFKYPNHKFSFRCNVGRKLKTIDVDGNVYWCDEYVGNKKGLVGNINDPSTKLAYKKHTDLFEDCKKCEVSNICRGRCRKMLESYSINHIRNYCRLTKSLIEVIARHKKELALVLKDKNYDLKSFYNIPECTEEIP